MDSTTGFISNEEGICIDGVKYRGSKTLDGGKSCWLNFQSGLINGRDRYYDSKIGEHNGAYLETFTIARKNSY